MSVYRDLRCIRKEILHSIDAISSPITLFEVQLSIVHAIKRAEREIQVTSHGDLFKEHLKLLRVLGDTIVWKYLHPHVIRQLSKNPSPPQSISQQGESFDIVLEATKSCAEDGLPALIADITNCIKIGDLIVCNDREYPDIVECKSKSFDFNRIMSGRTGRQVSRSLGTIKYLNQGVAKVYGEEHCRLEIESTIMPEYNIKLLDEVIKDATKNNRTVAEIDDGDIVYAIKSIERNNSQDLPDELKNYLQHFKSLVFGMHSDLFIRSDYSFAPPTSWPIDFKCRIALLERDIILTHFIDTEKFMSVDSNDGVIKEINFENKPFIFLVETNGDLIQVSQRFLSEVLYDYATITSTALTIIEAAIRSKEVIENNKLEETLVQKSKPKVIYVETLEEMSKVAKSNNIDSDDIILMPQNLEQEISKNINNRINLLFYKPRGESE